jgi:hypothetical protein
MGKPCVHFKNLQRISFLRRSIITDLFSIFLDVLPNAISLEQESSGIDTRKTEKTLLHMVCRLSEEPENLNQDN